MSYIHTHHETCMHTVDQSRLQLTLCLEQGGSSPKLSYYFKGVKRENMDNARALEWWNRSHFKDYEVQYSKVGLDGPWVTAHSGTADMYGSDEGWQEIRFPPAIGRYWRLFFRNTHGFGYVILEAVEFFGHKSVWCQQSEWCHRSIRCNVDDVEKYAVAFTESGHIDSQGLGISAGTHALYVRGSLGVGVSVSTGRRGDVRVSDGRVAVKDGTVVEFRPPVFAWSGSSDAFGVHRTVSAQGATDQVMTGSDGVVVVARFRMPVYNSGDDSEGTLVALGDLCNGGVRVRVFKNESVIVEKGSCDAGSATPVYSVTSTMPVSLSPGATYCYSASMHNGTLNHRIEKQFPLFVNGTVSYSDEPEPFDLTTNFTSTPDVSIGATNGCGSSAFPGAIMGVSVYAGELGEQQLVSACRRVCAEVADDGSCYKPAQLKKDQTLTDTSYAAGVTAMRLPISEMVCYKKYRLRVDAGSDGSAPWCLHKLALFANGAPHWQTIDASRGNYSASSVGAGSVLSAAFGASNTSDLTSKFCSNAGVFVCVCVCVCVCVFSCDGS
jgi:hypothetical protein